MISLSDKKNTARPPGRPSEREIGHSGTTRAAKSGAAGFSLLELLTVLLLLGIIAGIAAPAIGRFLDNLSFRRQTAAILATLRYARIKAITSGKEVYVITDGSESRSLKLTGGVDKQRDFDLNQEAYFTLKPAEITFYPEGQVTPALLTSVKGKRQDRIALDPLTGLPLLLSD